MRQLVPRVKRDRSPAAGGKSAGRDDDSDRDISSARRSTVRTSLQRAVAVLLALVAYLFLHGVAHPPSTALGVAYAVSALCLATAAWRLWWPTMR